MKWSKCTNEFTQHIKLQKLSRGNGFRLDTIIQTCGDEIIGKITGNCIENKADQEEQ